MKLQQLRYLVAVVDHGFNITAASERLFTSQPGVSKQLRLLEEELGVILFERKARNLTGLTAAGNDVVERARRVLREIDGIRASTASHRDDEQRSLSIATTHTQARYVLPEIIQQFRERYPEVALDLHQGTSEQIADLVRERSVDFAIATGSDHLFDDLHRVSCYQWDRVILVPPGHALAQLPQPVTLVDLAQHPLVTYVFSAGRESSLHRAFSAHGLEPDVVFTARDADVIKTYVKLGMGVGLVAAMAYDCDDRESLTMLRADHLFPRLTTWIGWHKDRTLTAPMLEFVQLVAPWLSVDDREALSSGDVEALTPVSTLPVLSGCYAQKDPQA